MKPAGARGCIAGYIKAGGGAEFESLANFDTQCMQLG
jgi:hypothetical protein